MEFHAQHACKITGARTSNLCSTMTSAKRDERSLKLSDTEIQQMSSLIKILKPMKTGTTFLGSEKSPTVSRMLQLLLKLKKKHLSFLN